MRKGTVTVDYIMEEPREAMPLESRSQKAQRESELRPSGKVGHAEDLVSRRQRNE